jgi:hypothetical protein
MSIVERCDELVRQHEGNMTAAARAVAIGPQYFHRLWKSKKTNPSAETLKKLGLRRVITYERVQ